MRAVTIQLIVLGALLQPMAAVYIHQKLNIDVMKNFTQNGLPSNIDDQHSANDEKHWPTITVDASWILVGVLRILAVAFVGYLCIRCFNCKRRNVQPEPQVVLVREEDFHAYCRHLSERLMERNINMDATEIVRRLEENSLNITNERVNIEQIQ